MRTDLVVVNKLQELSDRTKNPDDAQFLDDLSRMLIEVIIGGEDAVKHQQMFCSPWRLKDAMTYIKTGEYPK